MVSDVERHAIASNKRAIEGTVEDVGAKRLFRLDHRLSEMLRIDRADFDVIAIFDQDFGQSESKSEDFVDVTLNEEHSAGIIRHWSAIRHFRCCIETVENGLFVIRTRGAISLDETPLPLVGSLIVNAIKTFVQDWLYNRPKVC